jgi:hypothetical protein
MKKIYVLFAVVMAMVATGSGVCAQTTTRNLTWNLTGTQTWPTVGASNPWTNKANWVISGTSIAPATDVTSGDFLTIPNTSGVVINVTADMGIVFTNFVIEVQGAARIDIQSKVNMQMTAASSAFSLSSATANNGLTLEKANGANTTSLTLNGIAKALNQSNSALALTSTTSSHAVGSNSQAAGSTGYGGFLLGTLPVILTHFEANLSSGKKVVLSWTTEQEANSDHFTVEKSSDGIHWQIVTTVKAAGNSSLPLNYTASDETPSTGANFYRIAMIDLNGKTSYTIIKNVRVNAFGHVSLYPNPATDVMNISLADVPRADWSLVIFNHAGQVVGKYKFNKSTTTATLPVGKYSTGNYVIEISDGSTKQTNSILISHK